MKTIRSLMWRPDWLREIYFVFHRIWIRMGWTCHCGSGGHPRTCRKHPWGFRLHSMDLNQDTHSDRLDELEERIERIEALSNSPVDRTITENE